MSAPTKVLVIDDEPQLRKLVVLTLSAAGFDTHEAANGADGLREAAFLRPEIIVLDLGLPDLDGADVVRRLREWTSLPILVLSVRDDAVQKVTALEAGADDYVTKPFDGAELVARCRALLRRRERRPEESTFETADLRIDFVRREVFAGRDRLDLSATEYALLRVLAVNAGRVMTHAHILREVWGPNATDQRQYLRVYVAALRRKLGSAAVIETAPGIGYRLR
ncbi:MAG: response regulator transcription factor [Terrimicrobiaceae bacterium]|nr:response regulator transcription factor [Terrimicrobiaceae bacterium]